MKSVFFAMLAIGSLLMAGVALSYAGSRNTRGLHKTVPPFLAFCLFLGGIWLFGIAIPYPVLLLSLLTVLFNALLGHFLNLYGTTVWFDRSLHAMGAFSGALLFYHTLIGLCLPGGSAAFNAVVIFLLGVAAGAVFEVIEFVADRLTGSRNQKGLVDTNVDIIFNIAGALIAAVLAYFVFLRRRF